MASRFPNLAGGVRRVVTGLNASGRAVVVDDQVVTGDPRALVLWGADAPPSARDAAPPSVQGWWPPPGGVRVSLSTRAPDDGPAEDSKPQAWPDINDAAGFHQSDSVDVIVMISGMIWLELDDGEEVTLQAGDVLIQNGVRHRWRNRGQDWPIMAVVIIGAR